MNWEQVDKGPTWQARGKETQSSLCFQLGILRTWLAPWTAWGGATFGGRVYDEMEKKFTKTRDMPGITCVALPMTKQSSESKGTRFNCRLVR